MTLATRNTEAPAELMEQVVIGGDLASLTPAQRVNYYKMVCESLGLNPLTAPFAYIKLNNKLTLYAKRDCTDQLRALHHVSTTITSREVVNEVYVVGARATTPEGRCDESIGAVPIANLKGEFLANSYMKAETKAKRRVTLSIVGLGWLDETEVGSIADAETVEVDLSTGQVKEPRPSKRSLPRPQATPMAQPKPVEAPPSTALTLEQLQALVEKDMPWSHFELNVLRASWAVFTQRGGTPSIAMNKWKDWMAQQAAKGEKP